MIYVESVKPDQITIDDFLSARAEIETLKKQSEIVKKRRENEGFYRIIFFVSAFAFICYIGNGSNAAECLVWALTTFLSFLVVALMVGACELLIDPYDCYKMEQIEKIEKYDYTELRDKEGEIDYISCHGYFFVPPSKCHHYENEIRINLPFAYCCAKKPACTEGEYLIVHSIKK